MKNIQDHQKDSLTNTHLYIQNMICEHHFLSELAGTNINLTEIYTEITFNPYMLYIHVYTVYECVLLHFCWFSVLGTEPLVLKYGKYFHWALSPALFTIL